MSECPEIEREAAKNLYKAMRTERPYLPKWKKLKPREVAAFIHQMRAMDLMCGRIYRQHANSSNLPNMDLKG